MFIGKAPGPITTITLYLPNNLAVTDGAAYNDFNLGVLGEAGAAVAEYMLEGGDMTEVERQIKGAIGGNKSGPDGKEDKAITALLNSQVMSNFGMGSSIMERGRDLYLQSKGKAINPNTVLQYTNSTLRQYSFQFKMVAHSAAEADTIKNIVNDFRRYMYAKKADGGKTLNYPAKWDIQFMKPGGGKNPFLPQPYECYLEGLSAVYNSTGNSFHDDGSPVEVDVTLTFKETKALSRDEIEELQ